MLGYSGAHALDIAGPVDVFDTASRLLDRPGDGYRIEVVSPGEPRVRTCSGLAIETAALETGDGAIDILLVPGGWGLDDALADRTLVSWIGRAATRSRRVASVCGGAFLLAEAGLLNGRRATTHWVKSAEMARRYPEVVVDPNPIFISDGPFITSAGVSTGIDMSLALVEEDHGAEFALLVARYLVLYLKRPGGQAQFSDVLDAQLAEHTPIRTAQEWILNQLGNPLLVADVAERANMSPRNFARVFRREVGITPGQYIERARISHARGLLESTDLLVGAVARRCGFTAVETFVRAFGKLLGTTPTDYRNRFQTLGSAGLVLDAERTR
ncbi:transcriptional regulator, AraC family with amidase-like domain [Actinoplanes regularis]|uniref:Transcriptional regulator, AraC family with amidase-like domain n=1 Tax=Actinoplanes regularis TaxID=52697 RepID=A0A238YBW1_9ACTN|nr:transcriptional regulator [Actinoplanes regularis]SNR68452.1 transcriptional regulator, AraC family with amidase-like domain [Actinoplanes regularis]